MAPAYDEKGRLNLGQATDEDLRFEIMCCEIWYGERDLIELITEPAKVESLRRTNAILPFPHAQQDDLITPQDIMGALARYKTMPPENLKRIIAESPFYTSQLTQGESELMTTIRQRLASDGQEKIMSEYQKIYLLAYAALHGNPGHNFEMN